MIKGKLIAIGGAEDKGTDLEKGEIVRNNLNFFELGILRRIVEESSIGTSSHIEVITSATMYPTEVGNNYLNAFGKIGCTNVGIMNIRNRSDINLEYIDRIKKCNVVMFCGGNQSRLTKIYLDTEFLQILLQRFQIDDGFVVAGTSAGAMAMSSVMIYEGNVERAHLKGEIKTTTGLGFMSDIIFDSHFEKRGRFGRLAQIVGVNSPCVGIGLGEDTGMLITDGNKMEAIGSGCVTIIDGHDIGYNNLFQILNGNPFSLENLKVHFCGKDSGYLIQERKFLSP